MYHKRVKSVTISDALTDRYTSFMRNSRRGASLLCNKYPVISSSNKNEDGYVFSLNDHSAAENLITLILYPSAEELLQVF